MQWLQRRKPFWESTHAQKRQIPLEWDQLTGNASGEHRQIQLGGKYKSIRNENGWQELECTWRDTGWWIENCHKRNHNKIADFKQKTVTWIFWRGLHRHFKNFTFHFFSKSFLRKKILYQTLQFNLSRNFICGDRQMDKHALPGIEQSQGNPSVLALSSTTSLVAPSCTSYGYSLLFCLIQFQVYKLTFTFLHLEAVPLF